MEWTKNQNGLCIFCTAWVQNVLCFKVVDSVFCNPSVSRFKSNMHLFFSKTGQPAWMRVKIWIPISWSRLNRHSTETVSPPPVDREIWSLMEPGMFPSIIEKKIYANPNITTVLHSMTQASFQTNVPLLCTGRSLCTYNRPTTEKHTLLNHI